MKQEELESLCAYWQEQLGINNWKIEVSFVHRHEIDGVYAQCRVRPQMEEATVRIAYLDEVPPLEVSSDPEVSLVHELLHVRLWSANRSDLTCIEEKVYEASIEATARALVNLRKKAVG